MNRYLYMDGYVKPFIDYPTEIDYYGNKYWKNEKGEPHRVNGPASVYAKENHWYLNGRMHRVDGPAVERGSHKAWWLNGKRHRLDGPAIEYADGNKEWWENGVQINEST